MSAGKKRPENTERKRKKEMKDAGAGRGVVMGQITLECVYVCVYARVCVMLRN